jgi:hypothetical protein
MTGSELVRSIVHLYYGSFVDLARSDPTFDLDAELVETIEHEIQHHIEDKAGVHDLEDDDDLYDSHARFRADLDVPAGWYRRGERLAPGVSAVDLDLFVELPLRKAEFERLRGRRKTLTILDESVDVEIPRGRRARGGIHPRGRGPSRGRGRRLPGRRRGRPAHRPPRPIAGAWRSFRDRRPGSRV